MLQFIRNELYKTNLQVLIEDNEGFYRSVGEKLKKTFDCSETSDLELYNMIHEQKYFLIGDSVNKTSIFRNRCQVEKLKNTVQYEQRTPIWYKVRKNLITATNVASIIGSSKYEKREEILKKKLGLGKAFTSNFSTEHGKCYEDVAIQMYEKRLNTKVREYGLLRHPKIPFLGASPDGITDDGIMVEIKCPTSRDIDGNVYNLKTTCYYVQMQAQMEVCDLDICDFLECKIIDYENGKKDFISDGSCDFYGSNGLEKGVAGCMSSKEDGEKIYYIPDFTLSLEDKLNAIKNFYKENKKTHNKEENKYWNLKQYSVVRVKRDRDFWERIQPVLYDFWNEVLELRENKDLFEERYGKKKKSSSQLKQLFETTSSGFDADDFF